jgi:hypothetical protein
LSTVRAVSFGVGLLAVVHAAWLLSLAAERFLLPLAVLLWASPVAAAFLAAWLAERRRVLVGIVMALPATFAVLVTNAAAEWAGATVDFAGARGALALGSVALVWSAASALVGGVAAEAFARFLHRS